MMTETQKLLAEYVQNGSEQAFGELLRRYIDLVYSVAVRSMNGDAHRAQDVTQTVFIDLARSARKLPRNILLGGWLHRHTCFVASTLRRSEARRQVRERIASEMNTPAQCDFVQISPMLDHALNELSTDDRNALVLRFFEQLDFRSIGQAVGATEEAARKRVNRALEKLQSRLKTGGVTVSTLSLGAALATGAVGAAPAGLATTVLPAALGATTLGAGATAGLLKFMTASKVGFGLGTALGLAGVIYSTTEHRKNSKLAETNSALSEQITALSSENGALSNTLVDAQNNQQLGKEQFQELMRLRAQSGELKRELATLARSTNAVQRKSESPSPKEEQEAQGVGIRRMRDAKIWVHGLHQYQAQHQNEYPTNWEQVLPYLENAIRADLNPGETLRDPADLLSGTNQFEITYQGKSDAITNWAGAIVLREKEAWPNPTGGWNRTYGFADGHTEIHRSAEGNFEPWEQQHQPK
jgi:RNA polymerase sigma factor (sigma-70 family)